MSVEMGRAAAFGRLHPLSVALLLAYFSPPFSAATRCCNGKKPAEVLFGGTTMIIIIMMIGEPRHRQIRNERVRDDVACVPKRIGIIAIEGGKRRNGRE